MEVRRGRERKEEKRMEKIKNEHPEIEGKGRERKMEKDVRGKEGWGMEEEDVDGGEEGRKVQRGYLA